MNEHPSIVAQRIAEQLLDGVRPDVFRALAMAAIREWRQGSTKNIAFSVYPEFARGLIQQLAAKKETAVNANQVTEPFLFGQTEPWLQPLIDFFAWFVRAGLAIPLYGVNENMGGYAQRYRLTSAGVRVFDAEEDNALLPGFVQRVVKRCKGLPEEVAVHLADAQTCLEHGLGRPAVVLAGLAYEAAEDAAIDHLGSKVSIKKGAKAGERIAEVKKAIPAIFAGTGPKEVDRRSRALAAWAFADRLRERRNDGSHPRAFPDFADLGEVHELLLSAGRNLPGLWSVRV